MKVAYKVISSILLQQRKVLGKCLEHEDGSPEMVGILIGPKGGLTEAEIIFLKGKGAVMVTLGKRILRAETAALATVSAVMYELDALAN